MTMRIFKKIKDNISLLFNRDYKWNNHSIKIMMINQFELYSLFQQAKPGNTQPGRNLTSSHKQ